jgi:hypothetical protein
MAVAENLNDAGPQNIAMKFGVFTLSMANSGASRSRRVSPELLPLGYANAGIALLRAFNFDAAREEGRRANFGKV